MKTTDLDQWKSYSLPKTHVSVDDYGLSAWNIRGRLWWASQWCYLLCPVWHSPTPIKSGGGGKSSMIPNRQVHKPFWTGKLATSKTKLSKSRSAWINQKFSPTIHCRGERVSHKQKAHQHFLKIPQRQNLKKKTELIGGHNTSSLHHLPK